ncbi:MAG TPA: indole-3-glycerol phosphate synthase TrpC [Solirubrobacteraceae bacterium]|nr:indole-3-glycerol phosphate synthase TrpC [Solirubrobacteraceae bacterium]
MSASRAATGHGADNLGGAGTDRTTVLARILAQTRQAIEQRKCELPIVALEADAATARTAPGRLREALARPGIGAIAEFKRRSPSAGELRANADVRAIARAYEQGGASAMSVLTEGDNFDGSLADLRAARAACSLPILRKDFIVDPYQLYEARAAGADAVLLIVAALDDDELASLHERASAMSLDVLVEVHDSDELARAAAIGAEIVGVNNRDLRDLSVDVGRTSRLLAQMPAGALVVSESGIATHEQVKELEREGVAAVLVGERLMRAPDPGAALAGLLR